MLNSVVDNFDNHGLEIISVLKTTTQVNGKVGNSTPAPSQTPEPTLT